MAYVAFREGWLYFAAVMSCIQGLKDGVINVPLT